jgi:hypothetical protein
MLILFANLFFSTTNTEFLVANMLQLTPTTDKSTLLGNVIAMYFANDLRVLCISYDTG